MAINNPTAARKARLWKVCEAFIVKQNIACEETVYQTDRVIENAYGLIGDIVKVVGVVDREDDDPYDEDD